MDNTFSGILHWLQPFRRFKYNLPMKKLILLIFVLASYVSFGQPSPRESYSKKINAITEQLKTDSLNYTLIWERLKMKVNLLDNLPTVYSGEALQVIPGEC